MPIQTDPQEEGRRAPSPLPFAITVVTPPGYVHSQAFYEVAETLHHGLRALGHDPLLTDAIQVPGRRHIVLGANLLPCLGSGADPAPDAILYNLEQIFPGSPWLSPDLLGLLRRYRVWDYSRLNVAALQELGARAVQLLPIGYTPALTRIPALDDGEDIDVLFFGSLNPRRLQVLEALDRRGLRVQALVGVYGAARDRFIARSKIVLNVHYYEARRFEIVRASYLLANQRCVVSERGADAEEEADLAAGVVFADYPDLVERCCALVDQPAARRQVAQAGLRLMRARPVERYLAEALRGLPA